MNYKQLDSGIIVPRKYKKFPIAFDFFSGIGGFSLGLIQAGFEVIGAMDNDPAAAHTYMLNLGAFPIKIHYTSEKYEEMLVEYFEKLFKKKNVKGKFKPIETSGSGWIRSEREKGKNYPGVSNFFFGDITEVTGEWILEKLGMEKGELDLIVGGPPCQGFSKQNRYASKDDPRNRLVLEFAKKIVAMQPKTIAMEEVPAMANYTTQDGIPILDAFCMILEEGNYGNFEALRNSLRISAGLGVAKKNSSFRKIEKNINEEPELWD